MITLLYAYSLYGGANQSSQNIIPTIAQAAKNNQINTILNHVNRDPQLAITPLDEETGNTLLHYIAHYGHINILDWTLQTLEYNNIAPINNAGLTPLAIAEQKLEEMKDPQKKSALAQNVKLTVTNGVGEKLEVADFDALNLAAEMLEMNYLAIINRLTPQ